MALLKCKECGHEISSQARKCPNCGARQVNEAANKAAAGCVSIILVIIIVAVIASMCSPDKPLPDAQTASWACGDFVKKNLRDPDSADFVTDPLMSLAIPSDNGSFTSLLTVRANNGFGGKTVSTFSCVVAKDANGNWQLQSLNEVGSE